MTGSIEKLQSKYLIDVRWRTFPLHPDTPEEGRSLEELFRTDSSQIVKMIEHLRQTASQLGLPFGERHKTYNSRLAQELGLWAEDQDRGHQFHMAAFKAYFVDGKNLAMQEVLLELAASCGLPIAEASHVIQNRSYKQAVDTDWSDSRSLQVTAVPTLLFQGDRMTGAQSYAALQGLMLQHAIPMKGHSSTS